MATKNRSRSAKSYEPAHFSASCLEEPLLRFGMDSTHTNPKVGIPLYGPKSFGTPRHPSEVHIGFIGTGESVDNAQKFIDEVSNGVEGHAYHFTFPGCSSELGYRFEPRMSSDLVEKITQKELRELESEGDAKKRFELAVDLLISKLESLCQRDHPLSYVMVVLTEEFFEQLRVADYRDEQGLVHRDLRRAFKARAMPFKVPTQVFRESTTGSNKFKRDLEPEATRAWNLFTGMYFKVGGLPWGPMEISPGTCYIGVSFFQPIGESSNIRASVARAFDENGEGLVLRGGKFRWDEDSQGKSPHLPAENANQLVQKVIKQYQQERHTKPRRIVVHKTSRYETDERKGFEEALGGVSEYDLVAILPASDIRLLRTGKYPPLRGTALEIENERYLYTTGYVPDINAYPHGHVPSPIRIVDHIGDTASIELLRETLLLTKMDWNSANIDGAMPVTLGFARKVGNILREVPEDQEPESKYIYYM